VDRDGSRQDFEGPTKEEYEQWERKEEEDGENDSFDPKINPEKEREEIDKRNDPDHDTHHHRDLDGSSEAVPQWAGDDQIPVIQTQLQNYITTEWSDTEIAPHILD